MQKYQGHFDGDGKYNIVAMEFDGNNIFAKRSVSRC